MSNSVDLDRFMAPVTSGEAPYAYSDNPADWNEPRLVVVDASVWPEVLACLRACAVQWDYPYGRGRRDWRGWWLRRLWARFPRHDPPLRPPVSTGEGRTHHW